MITSAGKWVTRLFYPCVNVKVWLYINLDSSLDVASWCTSDIINKMDNTAGIWLFFDKIAIKYSKYVHWHMFIDMRQYYVLYFIVYITLTSDWHQPTYARIITNISNAVLYHLHSSDVAWWWQVFKSIIILGEHHYAPGPCWKYWGTWRCFLFISC